MRLRPKRFAAAAFAKASGGPRPITLKLGPAFEFDLSVAEAIQLATALADAIESVPPRQITERKPQHHVTK
ncbi:hypothetical protein [Mycobacterium conspicuum]|jgi:hypothetical protein|uniref:Uncharacterized protein n=1 Tax=Mycobacterium conspicuum TaxID=44010 RepID=A0A1X1SZE8_9MYCO|nr:hypothetical protein [Mycobacterium conspicuum]ORV37254.1 hypothetical protein AWC00_23095 [Mycobacterium conspicuum]BBZ38730.1 hypothetical protein MCNS_17930 [Mycobacterium conspicuum]CNI32516.1 Uncharacterised protein [Mycobacterium tuberculosis]